MLRMMLGLSLMAAAATLLAAPPLRVDLPPGPDQVDYYPADGARVEVNPPVFVWVPVAGALGYLLQVSRDPEFRSPEFSIESSISLQALRQALAPGVWYWRYGASGPGESAPVFSRVRRFELTADAVNLPFPDVKRLLQEIAGDHPRLRVRAAQVADLRERARTDLKAAVQGVVVAAEKAIGQTLPDEPPFLPPPGDPRRGAEYTRIFQMLRPFYAGMVSSAEAFLLTADERFGQEARRRLLHFMSWDPEGSTNLFHNDEPGMQIPRDAALTYDYVYPLLTDDERRHVCRVLAVRLRQLYSALRKRPFESRPFESHAVGSYLNNLLTGLLAIAGDPPEDPDVEEMLEYALLQFWSPYYPPWGGDDGGWSEGPSYWHWTTERILNSAHLIERFTGLRLWERAWFRGTPYFKLYVNPPYSRMSPFGDAHESAPVGFETMYKLAIFLRNPHALWYAQQGNFAPRGLEAYLFPPPDWEAVPPTDLPQARAFFDVGVVAMHSALADARRNVQLLLRSSPYGSISHAYADQNSFVLNAFGEPLLISSGYYDYYGSPHHAGWTRQSKAHNTILVNGEGQVVRSFTARGRILRFATNEYAHYALGDAAEAYPPATLAAFKRHVFFLTPPEGRVLVLLFDELMAYTASTYQWLLHALEQMEVDEEARGVTVRSGDAAVQVLFLTPDRLQFQQSGNFDVDPDPAFERGWRPQWHLTASTVAPAQRGEFLTLLVPYQTNDPPGPIEASLLEGTGCRAAEIRTAAGRHVVLFRHSGYDGSMQAGGLASNALALAVGFDLEGREIGRQAIE